MSLRAWSLCRNWSLSTLFLLPRNIPALENYHVLFEDFIGIIFIMNLSVAIIMMMMMMMLLARASNWFRGASSMELEHDSVKFI